MQHNNWRHLPRKEKKRLYGTRGRRKKLALALLEDKKFKRSLKENNVFFKGLMDDIQFGESMFHVSEEGIKHIPAFEWPIKDTTQKS
jgi:hypothetical protein